MSTLAIKLRFTDAELLAAARAGSYDIGLRIPAFCEFDGQRRREVAAELNVGFIDTYRVMPDEGLRAAYGEYIAGRFERGAHIPDRIWRHLSRRHRIMVCDTLRGRAARIGASQHSVSMAARLPLNSLGDAVLADIA